MRHYEIVFFAHPGQSEQIPSMLQRYRSLVTGKGGKVHRVEDWGRKKLAYPVNKLHKAHYVLLNIECDQQTIADLQYNFRFNDIILRFLVMGKTKAGKGDSPMLIATRIEKEQEERSRNKLQQEARSSENTASARKKAAPEKEPEEKQAVAAETAPAEETKVSETEGGE